MNEAETEIYPLTVLLDRYGGVYSGGKYTAWNLNYDEIPLEVHGCDTMCWSFWLGYKSPVGRGWTMEQAVEDLRRKLKEMKT